MKKEYTWDLESVYKDETYLKKDIESIKKEISLFGDFEKTYLLSAQNFYEMLKKYYQIEMLLDKMLVYTFRKYDADISDSSSQMWKKTVHNLYEEFSLVSSFIEPGILSFGYENVNKFYDECPLLKEYKYILDEIFRYNAHILSANEENLIASLSKAFSSPSSITNMLMDCELSFGEIGDKKLNEVNYSLFIKDNDRNVRKEAFLKLYKVYEKFNGTFSLALSSDIEKRVAFSRVRKFNSALEASLYDDDINVSVYNNLINVVSDNLKPLYNYYELKKEALGLKDFHMYDVYASFISDNEEKYSYEEAKELVINALKPLGDDYGKILKEAFNDRWIDVYPSENKKSGAYSSGSYLTKPFILLNFNGTYNDVSTLAHELGHSIHSYFSNKNNPSHYCDYKIFVAEVASQVNELLLNDYMLKQAKTKEEKIRILSSLLELFKASLFRQTMFAEFEKTITEKCENDEVLTKDNLNNTYYNLVKKYFGKDVIVDDEIKYEWQRIPHFYNDFYVYKYSLGISASAYIVSRILKGEEGATESYLNFLKTGGSMPPLEELKIAGVDLEKKDVIESAIEMFTTYLEELKKYINS